MAKQQHFTRSYESHEQHAANFARGGVKESHARTWLAADTVDAWQHQRMNSALNPLLVAYPEASWLTVGDGRYGSDAQYIRQRGIIVVATNISDLLLKEAKDLGLIDEYKKENAE